MKDFFVFRRMITPFIIQVFYWIATLASIVAGIYFLANSQDSYDSTGDIISGLGLLFIGPLVIRIWFEMLILAFRVNETLTEIKNNTERN